MRRARYHSLSALAAFALLGPGCGFDIVSQETLGGVVVATVHSPTADFARYKTFAIVDKVGLVTDDVGVTVKYVDAPAVLAQITADLEGRGFVKVAEIDPVNPPVTPPLADLAVNATALEATRTESAYWISFDGYWGPGFWGYPGYAWHYPWEWPTISYQVGTLLIEIADLRNPLPVGGPMGGRLESLWASASYGVAAGEAGYDAQRVLDSIDRAFSQSPYIQTK
jgi:hypothetical protein